MSWFCDHYAQSATRFREMADAAGATLHSLPLSAEGPDGPLAIDIAVLGPADAARAMVHCAGTHGIEGYAGAAIQLQLLDAPPALPPDTALVLVHVVNPYGMAWYRRTNENNVDLNRNFLFEDGEHTGAPQAYAEFDALLNPASPPRFDFFIPRTVGLLARRGWGAMKQATAGGQYEFPEGLFFGGKELQPGPAAYREWVQEHLAQAQHVFVIDVHTGLGERGVDTLLVEARRDEPLYQRLHATLGERVTPWVPEEGVDYAPKGSHAQLYEALFPDRQVDFVTQEFGTVHVLRVLTALRNENRWHLHGARTLDHPSKQGIRNAFAPQDPAWEAQILSRGKALIQAGLDLLGEG